MQCEKCKKEPATAHSTEISHQKVEKVVHLCEECMRKTTFGKHRILSAQCEKCKKKSGILIQVEMSLPSAKPKKGYFCEECIIEVQDRLQCKKCKRKLAPLAGIPQGVQDIRSKIPHGGVAIVRRRCGECSGTFEYIRLDYPE